MLSASTSMPCSSIARMRSAVLDMRRASVSSALPTRAIAAGTAQCACTSTVFTALALHHHLSPPRLRGGGPAAGDERRVGHG
jgi:hypothetical protein